MTSRRDFLKGTIAGGIAMSSLFPRLAQAQTSGYKALVCIMLRGGLDSHDCLVPTNASGYSVWQAGRSEMLGGAGSRRDLSRLRPLTGSGQDFGFVPELSPLADLFEARRLAVVPNVGPLIVPVTRDDLEGGAAYPRRLRSHNDQEATWLTLDVSGTGVTGWGGRMIDEFGLREGLSRVSIGDASPMASGALGSSLILPPVNRELPRVITDPTFFESAELPAILERQWRSAGQTYDNVFMRDVAHIKNVAVDAAIELNSVLSEATLGESVTIADNPLAEQLAFVANLISAHERLGIPRQIFVVQLNDFDTHNNHWERLPRRQTHMAEAMAAFQAALDGAGLGSMVTTFTVSDFGRTLVANASGTDHGWGGHHYVMGGAVRGGRVTGQIPVYEVDSEWHTRDRGWMVPQLSIEQYGAALGRWFGLDEDALDRVFPNLGRFERFAVDLF